MHLISIIILVNYSSLYKFLPLWAEDEPRNIEGSDNVEDIVTVTKEHEHDWQ